MRIPRASLVDRLLADAARGVVLVEAPTGYGKSWLLRKAWEPGVLRLRGELGSLAEPSFAPGGRVILDDAHLLSDDDAEWLVELIELADENLQLIIAGRMVADRVHEVVQLVDGSVIDSASMAITPDEIVDVLPERSLTMAEQLTEAAGGCVRVIASAIEQAQLDSSADPVALAWQRVRATSAATLQQLSADDHAMVGLLARSAGLDRPLLEKLGGRGVIERLLAAGVPLRRHRSGGLDLAAATTFRAAPVEALAAHRLAGELVERQRPIEAIGLLLDAGDPERAARTILELRESVIETEEPRVMLGLLARLGDVVDRQPGLLLVRAAATGVVGRLDDSIADIDRAVALAGDADPVLRRRIEVESARARLTEGRIEEAVRAAEHALVGISAGEERTYARAHEVLADCHATSDNRGDLQRAAESYRVAATAWEACGEFARARVCRTSLATGVLVPLGRVDEALSQFNQLLAAMDLSDAERSWTLLFEGFVLVNAGRFESAAERFGRVTDIGFLHDNPRLIAAAAWGRALVATCRGDLDGTIRWAATAENTALAEDDDVLGVPFLCDMTTAFGALGELELAGRYLARAHERRSVFPDQVNLADFILQARFGQLGDVDAQLAMTAPAHVWRVQLVAAHALARMGDLDRARQLLTDSERSLLVLGFDDAGALGERREQEALRALLERGGVPAPAPLASGAPVRSRVSGRLLRVIGSPMAVHDGQTIEPIPPGNPQRLVGVIIAHGGSASFDQLSEAIWPGEEVETSRTRLRNVLLRLRRVVGDIVVRSGNGVRLAPDVTCDLQEFERLALDALSSARADPELAGRVAARAVELGTGTAFADFEYEEWAIAARRDADQRMISLLDLLSVQAEDEGDLAAAQALAERALRLDRYTDSRYVRLAELLTMQERTAAAIAVLDDAAEVAKQIGGSISPEGIEARRRELLRRTASGGW
jgi:DNA-binding SARP family transcriptional activator